MALGGEGAVGAIWDTPSLQGRKLRLVEPGPQRPGLPGASALGRWVVRAWLGGRSPGFPFLSPRRVLEAAASPNEPSLYEAVGLISSHLVAMGQLSGQSCQRISVEIARFVRRLELVEVTRLSEVTAQHARDFVDEAAKQRGRWVDPAVATQYLRRSAIRILFGAARQLNLVDFDPTLDLVLPARSALRTRPLTDDEETLGRLVSRQTLVETRLPAAWALGQASAVSSELSAARVKDVDLTNGRVWLHGCSKREPRWAPLTGWGAQQLARVCDELRDSEAGLIYRGQGSDVSAQASSCGAIHEVLVRAGLAQEADVRPGSLAAWAGRKVFDDTGRIQDVARALGIRSLDRAARIIGWEWA